MITGIVGSEEAKFTKETERKAKEIIRQLILQSTEICSGECHLGGIDIWAKEETLKMGMQFMPFPPKRLDWSAYKARNMKIAKYSHRVICITVAQYPPEYKGMKFLFCYHCDTNTHVKSGGCWTVKKAIEMGKVGQVIVV